MFQSGYKAAIGLISGTVTLADKIVTDSRKNNEWFSYPVLHSSLYQCEWKNCCARIVNQRV